MLPKKAFKLFPHGESSPFRRPRIRKLRRGLPSSPNSSPDKDSPTTPLKGGAALEMNRKFDDLHIHSISHKKWYIFKNNQEYFLLCIAEFNYYEIKTGENIRARTEKCAKGAEKGNFRPRLSREERNCSFQSWVGGRKEKSLGEEEKGPF